MAVTISPERFYIAHRRFCEHLLAQPPHIPFTSFDHHFLVNAETAYKWRVYSEAREVLQLERWHRWKPGKGTILEATKAACDARVSQNLLIGVGRYGAKGASASPLYLVETPVAKAGLEKALQEFLVGGGHTGAQFGARFDAFATYLRDNQLGCKWAFLAYLCFLRDPNLYFTIQSTLFRKILAWYKVDFSFGAVEWGNYASLLEFAGVLKETLAVYGNANAVEIQSYLWVVSDLLQEGDESLPVEMNAKPVEDELNSRVAKAAERERKGALGEDFIFQMEKQKLKSAGRADLAERVAWVAQYNLEAGYDIQSFDVHGSEIHIEVKTTARQSELDQGFWLSQHEKYIAEQDDSWRLYRVCNIDNGPTHQDLGNIVQCGMAGWEFSPSSWWVKPPGVDR